MKATNDPPILYDRVFLFSILGLLSLGLLMVASASMVIAERQFDQPFYYLTRQAIYLAAGIFISLFVLRTPMEKWRQLSRPALFVALALLILVLIPGIGRTVNGSTRWISLGFAGFQVSELVKLCMVVYLAGYLVRHQITVRKQLGSFVRPLLLLGIIGGLLLRQPDFGAAVVIFLTALSMLFLAGVRLRQFVLVTSIAACLVGILAVSSPYRLERLTTFLNPWAHPFASGYQLTQALIAFGRGGWFGVGLGESVQKLFYLPEAHTDFLFAVLVEELGFVGGSVVIFLYALFILRAYRIASRALAVKDFFSAYLAYGLSLWLGFQALINLGVNMGILPTKGLTLPLMSSGGSSMLVNCIVIALLLRIDYEARWQLLGTTSMSLRMEGIPR